MHDHSKNVKLAIQLFQDKRRKLEVRNAARGAKLTPATDSGVHNL